jgi:hypothetical protein
LTTEPARTNGDKGGQSPEKMIVFIDLFESYLRSGRKELPLFRRSRSASVGIGACASPQPNFLQSDQLISSPLPDFLWLTSPCQPVPKEIIVHQSVIRIPRAIPKDCKKLHGKTDTKRAARKPGSFAPRAPPPRGANSSSGNYQRMSVRLGC